MGFAVCGRHWVLLPEVLTSSTWKKQSQGTREKEMDWGHGGL